VRRALLAGGAVLVLGASALGVGTYSYLKPTAAASGPIEAIPLTVNTTLLADDAADTSTSSVYDIQSSTSDASFTINEVLSGSPKTVVGTTDQVAGQIALDPDDTSTAQVGTIVIDARTLATDDSARNLALRNVILNTNQYEYITFTPTDISGLPDSLALGQSYPFQISGDLSIAGVTQPAVFEATLTRTADDTLEGSASTTIDYADWGVSIPSVPFVASVDNQVSLNLDFQAVAS
jgi:polyisoprenoid-binding protein YceI